MSINLDKLRDNRYTDASIAACFDNTFQELILLPTEKCNFRCHYCYEDFEIGKMKPWLVNAIKIFIDKRVPNIKELSLNWFGGEPFIAKKICLDIINHANEVCQANGVAISGGFTTNGYLLTNELVENLAKMNHASFQITLDGFEDEHNKTRILANGKGTFNKIWNNIVSLKQSSIDFKITLRLHISHQNYDSMKVLVNMISSTIGADERFNVHFHKITNLGGLNASSIKEIPVKNYSEIITEFQKILNVKYNSELSLHEERSICYAAKPNSLLVRADGRIGKCTVAFNSPKNTIGKFNHDGTITIGKNKLQPWLTGFETANPNTLSCPVTALYHDKKTQLQVKII